MKISATNTDWRDVVCCGLENQQIDFKSHQNWEEIGRVGRAKFARHAMAMANTQGGYIVIGVSEDENGIPNRFTGMTEAEASSFDPSTVGQTINTFADPPLSMDIVRPVVDDKRFVILVIYPFSDIPHVCAQNCEHELQRGGFYIRTPDARSKLAAAASEIHPLIRRALRNQRQMLGRMLRGILYEDKQTEPQSAIPQEALLEDCRHQAQKYLGKHILHNAPCFETLANPGLPLADISLTMLRQAIDQMERPAITDITWTKNSLPNSEIFATNDSLCGIISLNSNPSAFWEITCTGLFYLAVPLASQENPLIQSDQLSQTILLTLAALGELFSILNHPDALLSMTLTILHAENAQLTHILTDSDSPHPTCRIPAIQVSCQRSAADLEGGAASEAATELFAEICQRFNMTLTQSQLTTLRENFEKMI